ncbi:general negative regulator of transcription [Vairimorpha necatrix]|uniref:General negative regulator of transcription n=1 Tax=Vairimorpha necatrix TaxID=6039 RepID=A0AAX4JGH9_9MICR
MTDLQNKLKKIQQDKSKDQDQLESEDLEEMIKLTLSQSYKDSSTYYKPSQLSQIIPECYKIINFDDKKFDLYNEETLFYIFYSFPNDEIQKQAFLGLIKRGYVYSKFYRCFVLLQEKVEVDNSKHVLSMFDPFNWSMIKREVLYDEKFVLSIETKL